MKLVKQISVLVLILNVLFISCKKDNSNGNSCANATSFTVTQTGGKLQFNITDDNTSADGYEIAYDNPLQVTTGDQCNGKFISLSKTFVKTLQELNYNAIGSTIFYLRRRCSASTSSDWSLYKTIALTDYCYLPKNLTVQNNYVSWEFETSPSTTSYFQVQYGISGFALGSGTNASVNKPSGYSVSYADASMVAGNTYDFYVRAYCNTTLGWSDWVGPYTYYCTSSNNICITPSNLAYTIERNASSQPVGANFTWTGSGLSSYQYVVVNSGNSVSSGTITTIGSGYTPTVLVSKNTNYDFYVRGVCSINTYTAWAGPLHFNIGN